MTDNDIIKALECCITDKGDDCEHCPYSDVHYEQGNGGCCNKLHRDALDFINRQKAEIDRYKGVIKILERDVEDAKAEAIKEFAKRFEDEMGEDFFEHFPYVLTAIDNLVEELTHQPTKIEHNSLCETETYESR